MRWTWLLAGALWAPRLVALDICPLYSAVHSRVVAGKIDSGIPFRLLSVAVKADGQVFRKSVRISYNLWDEIVTVEGEGSAKVKAARKDAAQPICRALSLKEARAGAYVYRLFLNPADTEALKNIAALGSDAGEKLMRINWDNVMNALDTEQMLLVQEIKP